MGRRLVASLVLAAAASSPVPASASRRGIELQTMTLREASDAQAAGIGCAWSLPGERAMRFAAADDHAVVKVGGKLVRLRPADGAKDVFPFTYDAWTDGGVSVSVEKEGRKSVRGGNRIAGTASLTVAVRGAIHRYRGRLECGD